MMRQCDVLIIGGGPGGLAAAYAAKKSGAARTILLERNKKLGGILNQCIHDGFGLIRYHEALTGPEYAARAICEVESVGAEIRTSHHVNGIVSKDTDCYSVFAYTRDGIEEYQAKVVILSTGCRERTRGSISIPGSRPAGIFTAGVAQNLVNVRNVMIGKRVVILGSGDIGLIMARRLTLEGARVLAVVEIMPEPTGLARNVSQCLYDFDIPLYVKTTVSKIIGKHKIEAVELSSLGEKGELIEGSEKRIDCDALILSVGLIPENEVAQSAGVKLCENNAVFTDHYLQTSVAGVFSCGNSRSVMDLADYVSEQGEMAGRNAVHLIRQEPMEIWDESRSNCMKKGFPEKNSVTCVVCPNGCQVKWNREMNVFTGNKCSRGKDYVRQELTDPHRTVTTTIKCSSDEHCLFPIRLMHQVRKSEVRETVKMISDLRISGI